MRWEAIVGVLLAFFLGFAVHATANVDSETGKPVNEISVSK